VSLTLTLRRDPPGRISLYGITPDQLTDRSVGEIEKLPLSWGRETPAFGEFFDVAGCPDGRFVFEGDMGRFSDLGGGMKAGEIELHGDAGDCLGRDMQGGRLLVHGAAGDLAACGMSGGELRIAGDAGDRLGGALPWLPGGMRGGRVTVGGKAGDRCADKMRRGEIFVAGDVGAFCAARMVAGSVVIAGHMGPHPGYGMRRGTLFALSAAFQAPPAFAETVMAADTYLQLVWREWLAHLPTSTQFADVARMGIRGDLKLRRWMGDLGSDGRGEVFAVAG
jgi:formylmethanofuran dehydrogenase subunit C